MDRTALADHPIFSAKEDGIQNGTSYNLTSALDDLDLRSTGVLSRTMVVRGSDLIVAVGKELRLTSISESVMGIGSGVGYKVLRTPSVDFLVHQLVLSPEGKFLAIAGHTKVAVVILPRSNFARSNIPILECKCMLVGNFYHSSRGAARIAKIDWHPWGRGGASLLVLTVDGAFREYDVAAMVDEPVQTVHFLPLKTHRRGFTADDDAMQMASFCFGKGISDWGPLTVYGVARSGDIYAISPFLPLNATVPQLYLLSLESFVRVKRDVTSSKATSIVPTAQSTNYDQQLKYVVALVKQIPASSSSQKGRYVHVRRPDIPICTTPPKPQGPFLLQPEPAQMVEMIGEACDMRYIQRSAEGAELPEDQLGVVLVTFADGRVDVLLDLEKAEAMWDSGDALSEEDDALPSFYVYETIDLGFAHLLDDPEEVEQLMARNAPAIEIDPTVPDAAFVYHNRGVHALYLNTWMEPILAAMAHKAGDKKSGMTLTEAIQRAPRTGLDWVIDTYSKDDKATAPIAALTVLDNPYLGYTLLALTISSQLLQIDLAARAIALPEPPTATSPIDLQNASSSHPPYITLVSKDPYDLPPASRFIKRLLPRNPANKQMTSSTLRNFALHAEQAQTTAREFNEAIDKLNERTELQLQELRRQASMIAELKSRIDSLRTEGRTFSLAKAETVEKAQAKLSDDINRILKQCTHLSAATLSKEEEAWFRELDEQRQSILSDGSGGGLQDRAGMVMDRYRILRQEAKPPTLTPDSPRPATLNSTQMKGVERRLRNENQLLEDAKAKIEMINNMIESIRSS